MPYILSASFWSEIPKWLATILMSICQILDQIIYVLINWMYRVFILISEVDIFKDGTQIQAIANRMYIIVGIAMLFIFAYNIVLLIINPEGKQLGNMAKVVQNAIISVILIIFLPLIFTYLKTVQNHIVTQNVIGNIVLGSSVTGDGGAQQNNQAGVNESYFSCQRKCCPNGTANCDGSACNGDLCKDYVLAYNDAYENANITDFIWKKELRDGVKDGKVEYLGLVSALAGGFALWMFISFALDIGIRVGKMAFYEIISPIPVMMRILPGDKMFDKWFKGLKDTYLSIFIRLIVIYTCMYFVTLVPELMSNLTAASGADGALIVALANVIIILGILQFAKDAPKLISDMFGGGAGGLKFGIKDKYKSAAAPLGRVADMARSGVYSKMYGGKDGAGGSFFAGAWRGRRGFDKGKQATDAYSEAISDGSTLGGRTLDRLRLAAGMKTRYDSIGSDVDKQMKKAKIEKRREHNKMVTDSMSTLKDKAKSVVVDKDSIYKSSTSQFATFYDSNYRASAPDTSDIVDNGVTYSVAGKSAAEIRGVLASAYANNASSKTISSLMTALSMSQHTDGGYTYSMEGKNHSEMQAELSRAVANGASKSTISDLEYAISNFEKEAKASGAAFDLNDKNHYEMSSVLEEARGKNVSSETITEIERAIASYEKNTKDIVIDDALKGNYSGNIQGRYKDAMQNAIVDLQEQVAEGAAEYYDDTTGKYVSGIVELDANGNPVLDANGNKKIVTKIDDIKQFKDAEKLVKNSSREIDLKEREIKKQDAKFKAKKADRDYINKKDKK